MSKEERRIVSYHEVGHALLSALQKNSEPVQKITIVPRTMGALGYVMQVPEEEKYLNTQAELHDMLVGLLGGRAAEEIVFDTVTTGASNDIEKATGIARAMVTQYGMSKRFGLMGLETVESRYLDGRAALNCSDVTAAGIDEEVMSILKDCYAEAKRLLEENRALMDKLAEYLIEKETITGKEFMKIFRAEKGIPEPEEEDKKQPDNAGEEQKAAETSAPEKDSDVEEEKVAEADELEPVKSHWWEEQNPENTLSSPGMDSQKMEAAELSGKETENVPADTKVEPEAELQDGATQPEDALTQPEDEFARALRNRMYADRKDEQS